MLVKNILGEKGREVISISSDATLSEATRLLARRRIGAIVVRAVADESVTALARPVSAYMTRAVATCSENDTVEDLMEMMTMGRFRHLPVVDNDVITGMISIGDVVKTRIAETVQEATSLRAYITAA